MDYHYDIPRPCIKEGCPADATDRGYCKKDAPPAFFDTRRAERLPGDWAQRRAYVLRRDNYVCHVCGGSSSDAVDHIVPGDDHSFSNLAPIHESIEPYCHRTKTAQEGNATKKRIREEFEAEKKRRMFKR